MKSELYESAMRVVCAHTEVEREMVLSSNREDCVDARCLLIYALYRIGLTDTEIASLTGLTRPCISKLRVSFGDRKSKRMFSILWKQISHELEINS